MIVGCGIVGLVVAMQLREITNAYVLCIEAGTL